MEILVKVLTGTNQLGFRVAATLIIKQSLQDTFYEKVTLIL